MQVKVLIGRNCAVGSFSIEEDNGDRVDSNEKTMESELESLSSQLATLNNRMAMLEAKTSTSVEDPPNQEGSIGTNCNANFVQLQSQVYHLSASVNTHHKLLETYYYYFVHSGKFQ